MGYGVGVAVLVPGGGSLLWPSGWPGAGRIQTVEQRVYVTQFSAGIQPLPFLKLGASLLWYRFTEELTQQINFISTIGTARLGLAGNAVTFGLSGEVRVPLIPLTFGVDYRHQAPMTISGNAHLEGVPPTFASALQDQKVTEAVTVPNELFVGAAYDVLPNLKVMGAFTFERWIVYRSDTYVGEKGLVIIAPRNSHNGQVYRLAAEWTQVPFLKPLTLRLGGLRNTGTQPSDTLSPTLTDANSWAVTVGAGYEVVKGLRVDLGYEFALFDRVTATGIEAFPGSYETHVHILSAGVTWRPRI
jgi:long-subunit fatty acid transport protein